MNDFPCPPAGQAFTFFLQQKKVTKKCRRWGQKAKNRLRSLKSSKLLPPVVKQGRFLHARSTGFLHAFSPEAGAARSVLFLQDKKGLKNKRAEDRTGNFRKAGRPSSRALGVGRGFVGTLIRITLNDLNRGNKKLPARTGAAREFLYSCRNEYLIQRPGNGDCFGRSFTGRA